MQFSTKQEVKLQVGLLNFWSEMILVKISIKNFRQKIGKEVVGRAMSPLAILSILIVLVLPVPGEAHHGVDVDADVDIVDVDGEEDCNYVHFLLWHLLNFPMYVVYICEIN